MPSPDQPQRMEQRIVAAAVAVMRDRGVTNATTKEIAREAGVSEGSLYNHFENKTALFGAAFAHVTSGVRAAMQDLFANLGRATVQENLARFASAAICFYGELLPMTGSVLANPDVLGWLQRTGRSSGLTQGHAALERYLAAEQQAGRLSSRAEPAFIAGCLLGACQHRAFATLVAGVGTAGAPPGLEVDVDDYAAGIVRVLLTAQEP